MVPLQTGSKLEDAFGRISPVFSVIIPKGDAISPSPTLPPTTLTLPAPQIQQLLNWPELFPPIRAAPNHPLFTTLAREAKKASSIKRAAAEEEIRLFVEQKRAEVMEAEALLKNQVQIIWKAWRESQDRASVSQPVDPRTHTRRQSSAASTNIKPGGPTVIRSFNEQPSTPRESYQSIYASSFSPSTMTPRVHPQMSGLATSLRQSGMHMPRPPSPPLASMPPPSELSEPEADSSMAPARSKQPLQMAPLPAVDLPPLKTSSAQSKRPRNSAMKRQSMEVKRNGSPDSTPTPSETMSPVFGSLPGKRKAVTFSSEEPDVVTVTRQLKSEKLQKIKEDHARPEEVIFDFEDLGDVSAPKPPSPEPSSLEAPIGPSPAKRPRRFQEDDDGGVKISFAVPPSMTSGWKRIEYTMARSLPSASILASSSLGLKNEKNAHGFNPSTSLEAPYATEFRKIMAGQTPSHRAGWNTGSFGRKSHGSEEESGDDDSNGDSMEHDNKENIPAANEDLPKPSTSIPIPAMVRPVADVPDNNFEHAMSKSVDPGPVLELLTDQRYSEGDEDQEGEKQTEDMMKKLVEGRGSHYAQRILSHQNRGVPASMWRTLA